LASACPKFEKINSTTGGLPKQTDQRRLSHIMKAARDFLCAPGFVIFLSTGESGQIVWKKIMASHCPAIQGAPGG
jgi:hypothetical protein